MENKQAICTKLTGLLNDTRQGKDIIALVYAKDEHNEEFVTVHWLNGYKKKICVTADSGTALIKDVLQAI